MIFQANLRLRLSGNDLGKTADFYFFLPQKAEFFQELDIFLVMRTIKENKVIISKSVVKLYSYNSQITLRAGDENTAQRERLDKKFLSETDMDKINANASFG